MKRIYSLMYLTKQELGDIVVDNKVPAVVNNICQRCGHKITLEYCDNCEELSRISVGDYLYFNKNKSYNFTYHGVSQELNLTKLQKECSDFLVSSKTNNLVWAVCGAGKTEITFDLITSRLRENKIVCFAITRKDILYEIAERLEEYYTYVDIAIINSDEYKFVDAQIYVMTTNQILRFKNCFSLIIVDEVDAFPYEYNPKYDYGVNTALEKEGKVVYLTSTPSDNLLNKNLDTFIINRRWHGHDLPVPIVKYYSFSPTKIPFNVVLHIIFSKRQQLIFISNKKYVDAVANLIEEKYKIKSLAVHSESKYRKENIDNFRNKSVKVLVTTTILERGVTFEDIDVHVLDSSSELYTISALVQIAGRVGRKKEYQDGKVYFYSSCYTKIIKDSVSQIKNMNMK